MTLDEARLLLTNMSTCPVCQGNGTMWLREEGNAMPFGVEVQCWHCSGSGTEVQR